MIPQVYLWLESECSVLVLVYVLHSQALVSNNAKQRCQLFKRKSVPVVFVDDTCFLCENEQSQSFTQQISSLFMVKFMGAIHY